MHPRMICVSQCKSVATAARIHPSGSMRPMAFYPHGSLRQVATLNCAPGVELAFKATLCLGQAGRQVQGKEALPITWAMIYLITRLMRASLPIPKFHVRMKYPLSGERSLASDGESLSGRIHHLKSNSIS